MERRRRKMGKEQRALNTETQLNCNPKPEPREVADW